MQHAPAKSKLTSPQIGRFALQAVNKEADHIQLVALTRALQIHIRVAYLDPSAQAAQTQSTATSGGDRVDCDWVLFEEDASESLGEGRAVLYRELRHAGLECCRGK